MNAAAGPSSTGEPRGGVGRLVLPLIGLAARPLAALGVDAHQLRVLLGVKLLLDDRRPMNPGQVNAKKPPSSTFRITLAVNLLFGIALSTLLLPATSALTGLTLLFAALLTFLSLNLVGGYSDSLLDPADQSILAPRPVSHRTALAARVVHVLIFVGLQTLALTAPAFVVGSYKWGWTFLPLFAPSVAAAALFVMAAVMLVYAAVLRLAGRERLRDLVTYVQVVLVVVTAVGYQVGARAIDFQRLGELDLAGKPWIFLLPPAWFAGPVEAVLGAGGAVPWALAALALLAPLACGWAVIRYLADAFFLLFEAGGDAGPAKPARPPRPGVDETGATVAVAARRSLGHRLGRRLCRLPAERAGFALAWMMMGRDRQTKLRLYPTIGMMLAFAMLPVLDQFGAKSQSRSSGTLFFSLYLVGVFGATLANQLRVSEQGAAAEAVRAAPLDRPGSYQLGALKALIVRLLMPTLAVLLAVLLWRFGWAVAPDLLLATSAALLVLAAGALLGRRQLPFSVPPAILTQARTVTEMFLLMALAGFIGALHAVVSKFLPHGVWLAIPLVLGVALLCLRAYGRTGWDQVEGGHS